MNVSLDDVENIFEKLTENEKYNNMTLINKLFKYYQDIVDKNANLDKLAKSYGISKLKDMRRDDKDKRFDLIVFLYDSLYNVLSIPPAPPLSDPFPGKIVPVELVL